MTIRSANFAGFELRQPVSGLTHLAAAVVAMVGLGLLVGAAMNQATVWHVVSFAIYGTSLVALYLASGLYHLLSLSPRGIQAMRRLDHSMVAVLIAGSYTPICMVPLRHGYGLHMLAGVWALALAVILVKVFWLDAPRWITVGIFLFMGWVCVVAIGPLQASVPAAGLYWLLAGGLFYSVGAVIYALKWPDPLPRVFGFHEVWHLFVIAGTICHWWMMRGHILPLPA